MSCMFPNCNNTKHFCKNTNVRFFKVPTVANIRQKWLEVCNRSEEDLPKDPLVCSVHFGENYIAVNNKRIRLEKMQFQ